MAGPGFRFGTTKSARRMRRAGAGISNITPGGNWNGSAGSGFASPPIDPARTTAKPAMRIIVPPNQAYTEDLLVGVYAGANFAGSLFDNLGLEKVVAHYEGNRVEIGAPSYKSFSDANGRPVSYLGWWIRLKRDGRDGVANLYFEAFPKDPTMQRRVIGPFAFLPSAVLHDYSVQVAPSQTIIVGSRYQTMNGALLYLAGVGARNPLVTITEGGTYDIPSIGTTYSPAGRCRIVASVPVTIGKSVYTTDAGAQIRCRFDGLHFRGQNITIDTRFVSALWHEGGRSHWLDGIRVINSAGRGMLWRKGTRPIATLVQGAPYITECRYDGVSYGVTKSSLARGNDLRNGYNDVATDCPLAIGNYVEDWDSTQDWHHDVDAMTVSYTGPETTATLTLAGTNDANSRTFTARWGSNQATFTVGKTEAMFNAGTNYNVSNVVNWLNGLNVGFTATLIDDSRRASALSLPGLKGVGFGPVSVKNISITLVTEFDIHADFVQQNNLAAGGIAENLIIADNFVNGMVGQDIFLTSNDGAKDFLVLNNTMYNKMVQTIYAGNSLTSSQVDNAHSHVVIVHNTWASQHMNLRSQDLYTADAYCLFANNVLRKINWLGPELPTLRTTDNHIFEGNVAPSTAVGTTIGGDQDSLFAASSQGDFTPAGALLTNMRAARMPFSRRQKGRAKQAATLGAE